MRQTVNKRRELFITAPRRGVGCGVTRLSFFFSARNQNREWKRQQASKGPLLLARLADKGAAGALQTACCFRRCSDAFAE